MRAILRVLLKPLFGQLREELDDRDLGYIPSDWVETEQEADDE